MDIIKENMFFVVMGVVVLIALVLFVGIVRPLQVDNKRREGDVNQLWNNLDRLLAPGKELPNSRAIAKATTYSKAYNKELSDLEKTLSDMHLGTKLRGLKPDHLNSPATFKAEYATSVEKLQGKLKTRDIAVGPDAWYFWDWKEGVPNLKVEGVLATKEYFLIEKLVEVITSPGIKVIQLDRLEVNPGEIRSGDYSSSVKRERVEPYFDAHPFVLEIRMDIQHYELLIEKLLTYKRSIPIIIRSMSMMRIEDDPEINRQVPPLFVGVRVEGWALDYNKKEATASDTRPDGGVLGRRR